MRRNPIRNASSDAFFAWVGEVLVVNIQMVCGRENVNQQLRIRAAKKAAGGVCAATGIAELAMRQRDG